MGLEAPKPMGLSQEDITREIVEKRERVAELLEEINNPEAAQSEIGGRARTLRRIQEDLKRTRGLAERDGMLAEKTDLDKLIGEIEATLRLKTVE